MATDKQITANRLNAQKCTGPKTPEGKAISSQNALKTGLDAESELIHGERPSDYETLAADYYTRYRPVAGENLLQSGFARLLPWHPSRPA